MQPTKVECMVFRLNQKIVFEEWLSVYPKSREQSWFHRIYDEEKKSINGQILQYLKVKRVHGKRTLDQTNFFSQLQCI